MAETTKVVLSGDKDQARNLYSLGAGLLDTLKNSMSFNNLEQGRIERVLADGSTVICKSVFGVNTIEMFAPVKQIIPPKEEMIAEELVELVSDLVVFYVVNDVIYIAKLFYIEDNFVLYKVPTKHVTGYNIANQYYQYQIPYISKPLYSYVAGTMYNVVTFGKPLLSFDAGTVYDYNFVFNTKTNKDNVVASTWIENLQNSNWLGYHKGEVEHPTASVTAINLSIMNWYGIPGATAWYNWYSYVTIPFSGTAEEASILLAQILSSTHFTCAILDAYGSLSCSAADAYSGGTYGYTIIPGAPAVYNKGPCYGPTGGWITYSTAPDVYSSDVYNRIKWNVVGHPDSRCAGISFIGESYYNIRKDQNTGYALPVVDTDHVVTADFSKICTLLKCKNFEVVGIILLR